MFHSYRYCDHSLHNTFDTINGYTLCGDSASIIPTSDVEVSGSVNQVTTPLTLFTLPGQTNSHIFYYLDCQSDYLSSFSFFIWFSLSSFDNLFYFVLQDGYFSVTLTPVSTNEFTIVVGNFVSDVSQTISSYELVGTGWHHFGALLNGTHLIISIDHLWYPAVPFEAKLNISLPIVFGSLLDGEINVPVISSDNHFSDPASFARCVVSCGESISYVSASNNLTVVEYPRKRSLSLTVVASLQSPAINTYTVLEQGLTRVHYLNTLDEPSADNRLVRYKASDSVGYGPEAETNLYPILLNDKEPIVDLNGENEDGTGFATTFIENSGGVSLLPSDAFVLDQDSGDFALTSITLNISNPIDLANERLFTSNLPADYTSEASGYTLTITSVITKRFLEWTDEILTSGVIFYINDFIEPTIGTRLVRLTVIEINNGYTFTDTEYIYIFIQAVNDEPVIDLNQSDLSTIHVTVPYSEGDMDVTLLTSSLLAITDSDSINLLSAIIWLTPVPDGTAEYIYISNDTSGALTVMQNDTFISITGLASTFVYENLLLTLTYTNLNDEDPNNSLREIAIRVYDSDQQPSETAFVYIDFTAINDAPIIDLEAADASTKGYYTVFVEETGCVSIVASDATIVDVDGNSLLSLTAVFREGNVDVAEILNATYTDGLSVVRDATGGLVLSGDRSVSDYIDVLRTLQYCNSGDEPTSDVVRNVTISVVDAEGGVSNVALSEVMVERVNDNPNVTVGANTNASFGSFPEPVFDQPIIVEDVDSNFFFRALIYIFYPLDGKDFEIITFEGELGDQVTSVGPSEILSGEFQGGIFYNVTFLIQVERDKVEEVISRIRYSNIAPNPNTNETRQICVSVLDLEGGASALSCVIISINEPNVFVPQFLNELQTIAVSEATPISAIIDTAVATDQDQDTDLTFSIASVTATPVTAPTIGIFYIDSNGNIILMQSLDAESVMKYELALQVSDSGTPSKTGQALRTLTIQDANDITPTFSAPLNCSIGCTFCMDEGLPFSGTFIATDGDKTSPNNVIASYSVNSDKFQISSAGVLTNINPIDYESGPVINLVVTAVDGGIDPGPLSGQIEISICINNIDDESPTTTQRTHGVYVKGADPVLVDQFLDVTDVDSTGLTEASISITVPADPSSVAEDCTDFCFNRKLEMCQSTLTLFDLLDLAVVTNNVSGVFLESDPFSAPCPYIRFNGKTDGSRDLSLFGYGFVSSAVLPTLVAQSVTVIAELYKFEGEGYILSINDDTNRFLSIWLQKSRITVFYANNANRFEWKLSNISPDLVSDDYWSLVVTINPSLGSSTGAVHVYRDCNELTGAITRTFTLGTQISFHMAIGQRFPETRSRNRITSGIRNLFIIPSLLPQQSLNCFCPCHEFIDIRSDLRPNTVDVSYATNALSFTNRGSFNDLLVALRALQFASFFNNPINTGALLGAVSDSRSLRLFIEDPEENRNTAVLQVYVANALLPLTIDLDDSSVGNDAFATFTEDTSPVALFQGLGLLFKEGQNARPPVWRLTLTLLNPLDGADEYLYAQNYSNIAASVDPHEIVFTGPGAPIHFKNALQTVTYFNQKNLPDTTTRRIQVMFTTLSSRTSAPSTLFLSLSAANDCPQIYLNTALDSAISISLPESSPALFLFPDLSIQDTDGDLILQASLEINSSTYIQGEDLLTFNSSLAALVDATLSADSRVLIATRNATLSVYQAFFRTVSFQSISNPLLDAAGDVFTSNNKRIILQLTDSSGSNLNCPSGIVDLVFVPNDAPPTVVLPSAVVNFTEESNSSVPILWDLTLSDSDSLVLGRNILKLKMYF